jgi:hypothetical protein
MKCSWSLNFEQSHWVRISAIPVNSPERTKMLVSDPAPRRIPKLVGIDNGTFTNPPSTRCTKSYR